MEGYKEDIETVMNKTGLCSYFKEEKSNRKLLNYNSKSKGQLHQF